MTKKSQLIFYHTQIKSKYLKVNEITIEYYTVTLHISLSIQNSIPKFISFGVISVTELTN